MYIYICTYIYIYIYIYKQVMNWDPHQSIRVLNRKTRAMYICYRLRSKVTCLKTFNCYFEFHASHEAWKIA